MKRIVCFVIVSLLLIPSALAQDNTPTIEVIPIQSNLPQFQLSPDGKTVVFYEDSRLQNEEISMELLPIHLVDVDSGEVRATMFKGRDYTRAMAISLDSSLLATTEFNGDLFIWDMETGELIKQIDAIPSQMLMVFLDNDHLLTANSGPMPVISIWDISTESIIRVISPDIDTYGEFIDQPPMQMQGGSPTAIIPHPDNEQLIIATQMDEIFLVDVESGDRRQMRFSEEEFPQLNVRKLIPAPESNQVYYMTSSDGFIYRLNLDTRVEIEVLAIDEEDRLLAFSLSETSDRMLWLVENEDDTLSLYLDSVSEPGSPQEIEIQSLIPSELLSGFFMMRIEFSSDGNTAIIGGFTNRDNADNVFLKLTFDG